MQIAKLYQVRCAMKKNAIVAGCILVVIVSAALISSVPVYATSHEIKQQKLIEAAKKEGELNIIATWKPVESKAIFAVFERSYPFIKIRQTGISGRAGF